MQPTRRERAWLRRLHALVDTQPENTWVYVVPGAVHLMRLGPDGEPAIYTKPTWSANASGARVPGTYELGRVMTRRWDFGDGIDEEAGDANG